MIRKNLIYFVLASFLFLQLSEPVLAVQDVTPIDQQIKKARSEYYEGNFEQAQQTILSLLKNPALNKDQQFKALIVLAEIRHALNDELGARKIIRRILEIRPDYNPSIKEEPPSFVALVHDEHQKMPKKHATFYQQKKWWFISGAAVVGVVSVILFSGNKNKAKIKPLPNPPNWPE